jgi:hypothetical protein
MLLYSTVTDATAAQTLLLCNKSMPLNAASVQDKVAIALFVGRHDPES